MFPIIIYLFKKCFRKWGQYKGKKNFCGRSSHLSLSSKPTSHLLFSCFSFSTLSSLMTLIYVVQLTPPSFAPTKITSALCDSFFHLFFLLVHFSPVAFCVPSFNFHLFVLSPTLLSQNDAVWSSLFCHLSRLYFFSSFPLHPVSYGTEQPLWETINGLFFVLFEQFFRQTGSDSCAHHPVCLRATGLSTKDARSEASLSFFAKVIFIALF